MNCTIRSFHKEIMRGNVKEAAFAAGIMRIDTEDEYGR